MDLILKHKKDFILIGNKIGVCYKNVYPLMMDYTIKVGFTKPQEFMKPESQKKKDMQNLTIWYTTLPVKMEREPLNLVKKYYGYEKSYPHYLNYDAIEVGRTANIPGDYYGNMGVPVTYWLKHCPEQFEVMEKENCNHKLRYITEDGTEKQVFGRIIIRRIKN